jgi:sialic acid synthase SpsE/endonuclease IV
MIIQRNIREYLILTDESIHAALGKISKNQNGFVVTITEEGAVEGVLTDGDFRRWVASVDDLDLSVPVHTISKKQPFVTSMKNDPATIAGMFSDEIRWLPIVDQNNHITAIAFAQRSQLSIGEFEVGDNFPSFIIAEIGNNHNGDARLAKRLVYEAKHSGANCVKFQMRDMASLYRNTGQSDDIREDLGSQYVLDTLARFQLGNDELFDVFDYAKSIGIMPLCTPWDMASLERLENYGIEGYKIASADLTNHQLLKAAASTSKPVILSTGMSTESEIIAAVEALRQVGGTFALLHCNSTYPAPFSSINLLYMDRLKNIGKCEVGYSGHERGYSVVLAAIARGARVIEKHFTLDRSLEGNDHKVSLLPGEFKKMVSSIRDVETSMGRAMERQVTQGEMINRENLAKSLTATGDIANGTLITQDLVEIKSPGQGLQPDRMDDLLGRVCQRNMVKGDFFFASDLLNKREEPRAFSFKRPWGVPVRYHDFVAMSEMVPAQLLEFHFSFRDLEENPADHFAAPLEHQLIVHAPEIFSGSYLLNLAAEGKDEAQRGVKEMQRVVDVTRSMKPFFPNAERPLIIANVGGFTETGFVDAATRTEMYSRLAENLSKVDTEGVEITPQTMPPFPWLFGGQRHHNLFVDADEIVKFCTENNFRVCLDISHSKLACTHFQLSFASFIKTVAPFSAHLHLADAAGVDDEGLQIADGDIDWSELAEWLEQYSPEASFIPEIWQGHKDMGSGFWLALSRLEKWL